MNPNDLIPVPLDPRYLWDPRDKKLYSTKVSFADYYAIALQRPNQWNDYEGGYCVSIDGKRCHLTEKYLHQLEKEEKEVTVINNNYTANPADWKTKFIIGSLDKSNGVFSVQPNPARQPSKAAAQKEAERLAQTFKDKKFVVLEVIGIASVQDVVWE